MSNPRLRREVEEAIKDYKYLLNRGYPQKSALNLVVVRYGLKPAERSLLLRCVHRDSDVEVVRRALIRDPRGKDLILDGYNTILTLVSALECKELYLCDDGIVRDLRSAYVKDFGTKLVNKALEIIDTYLRELKPKSVKVFLDANVSWSARHAEFIRGLMPYAEVVLAKKADIGVITSEGVVCSSDYLILKSARAAYDLAGNIVKKLFPEKVIDLSYCLNKWEKSE